MNDTYYINRPTLKGCYKKRKNEVLKNAELLHEWQRLILMDLKMEYFK